LRVDRAADHKTVLDLALAQLPDDVRHGIPILVSTDGAGGTKEFLHHVRSLRDQGVDIEFSMGFTMNSSVQAAAACSPASTGT
jgi:hypothetical protein